MRRVFAPHFIAIELNKAWNAKGVMCNIEKKRSPKVSSGPKVGVNEPATPLGGQAF